VTVTPLVLLRHAWQRHEREQFLEEIVKALEEERSVPAEAPRQRQRSLGECLYPPPRRR